MPKIACRLLGCICSEVYPGCHRCETGIYDVDYVQIGLLDPVFRAYARVRRFVERFTGRKCDQCGRRYWRGNPYVCSDKCFNDWLPF